MNISLMGSCNNFILLSRKGWEYLFKEKMDKILPYFANCSFYYLTTKFKSVDIDT